MKYSCGNFWAINIYETGIVFFTFSDLIPSGWLATSIMAFYAGVALIAGGALRGMIYKGDRAFIAESPNTEAILNLIDCIYIARIEKNIKRLV